MIEYYLVEGINPEPWEAPEYSRGKGGKPNVYKSAGLRAYQEALAEEFTKRYPGVVPVHEPCSVTFAFWRELGAYRVGDGRRSARHVADATNLQKSTEDALQKLLFTNDHLVHHIESYIMEQDEDTRPAVLIVFRPRVTLPGHLATARRTMGEPTGPLNLTSHLHPDADVPF